MTGSVISAIGRGRRLASAMAAIVAAVMIASIGSPARAGDVQVSIFGGANWNFDSKVDLRSPAATQHKTFGWDGDSFGPPPYWGVRGMYWLTPSASWGFGVEYVHAKAIARTNFATDPIYSHFEFTDGNNLIFANAAYRYHPWLDGRLQPYAGFGLGVAIPHVEVTLKAEPAALRTFEYQFGGFAAQGFVGLEWLFLPNWSTYVEGKISYSDLDTKLKDGGTLKTYLWQPQIAVGLSYRFNVD